MSPVRSCSAVDSTARLRNEPVQPRNSATARLAQSQPGALTHVAPRKTPFRQQVAVGRSREVAWEGRMSCKCCGRANDSEAVTQRANQSLAGLRKYSSRTSVMARADRDRRIVCLKIGRVVYPRSGSWLLRTDVQEETGYHL